MSSTYLSPSLNFHKQVCSNNNGSVLADLGSVSVWEVGISFPGASGEAKGGGKGRNMAEHSMSIHCTPKPGCPHTLDLQQWSICCPQSRSSPVCVTTTTCTLYDIWGQPCGVWKTQINESADHGLQCESGLESSPLQTAFNCNLTRPFVTWRTKTGAPHRIVCP